MTHGPSAPGLGPTRAIEEWWQDELTAPLVNRISSASHTQLHEFIEFYDDHQRFELPSRPSGLLRPRVIDVAPRNDVRTSADLGLSLLLYAHEVVVDDPLRRVLIQDGALDRVALKAALHRILELRPLDLEGIVHYEQSTHKFMSKVRHPSRSQHFFYGGAAVSEVVESWQSASRIRDIQQDEVAEYVAFGGGQGPVESAAWLIMHVLSGSESVHPNLWNPFARNLLEADLLDAAMRDLGAARADNRGRSLTKLSAIDVPDLGLPIAELVTVRQSSDAFDEWRTVLRRALDQVEMLPADAREWKTEARNVVAGELQPFVSKLQASAAKSPVLSAAHGGFRSFALAGLGAMTGGIVTGDLLGATVGAGVTVAAEASSAYMDALRRQRSEKAVLQVALTLCRQPYA